MKKDIKFKVGDHDSYYCLNRVQEKLRHIDIVISEVKEKLARERVKENLSINDKGLFYSGSGVASDIKEVFKNDRN